VSEDKGIVVVKDEEGSGEEIQRQEGEQEGVY
jgi:hypothetical protein